MPWPPEYQRASVDFEKFMLAARDHAGLATTNMAWNMVEGVLHAFRRRLTLEQAHRFADQLPPAVRGLFIEGWRPGNQVCTVGTRTEMLDEVRSLRSEHNFSPDNAIESVGFALFAVLPSDAFARALDALPLELRELWSGVGTSAWNLPASSREA
ncbi:DUF2267 domain-containing protein [Acidovorax sp. LjRoot118]|uniref:DUF2267 domain-containing protein n=1 Tax=Acidovorax sp. LjRoot118 TaxID=3342256 RepID=UPI003ECD68EF